MGDSELQPTWKKSLWYVVLGGLTVLVLFPVYMALVRALSAPAAYVRAGQPPYPVDIQWDIFRQAWIEGDLSRKMGLSLIVTAIIVVAQVVTAVLAAYAFAFLEFRGRTLVFYVFMATLLLPLEVTLIPNVRFITDLGWLNSVPGLTAPFLATAFGAFLIRQGFLGIPRDLRDAAALDGFGHLAFLRRVAIPVTRPVIASFLVLAFLAAWNQYLWPRSVVTEGRWDTIQIGLKDLTAANVEKSNIGPAAALLAALPVLLLLIFLQRHLIRGLTAGAVKG
jgi:sn-glycerol 3-phosphate transport system permease protein